ncbi:hypothetical protein AAY473_004089 [Plecturocebus cupreus]
MALRCLCGHRSPAKPLQPVLPLRSYSKMWPPSDIAGSPDAAPAPGCDPLSDVPSRPPPALALRCDPSDVPSSPPPAPAPGCDPSVVSPAALLLHVGSTLSHVVEPQRLGYYQHRVLFTPRMGPACLKGKTLLPEGCSSHAGARSSEAQLGDISGAWPSLDSSLLSGSPSLGFFLDPQIPFSVLVPVGAQPESESEHCPPKESEHCPSKESRHCPSKKSGHCPPKEREHCPPKESEHCSPKESGHCPSKKRAGTVRPRREHCPSKESGHCPPKESGHCPRRGSTVRPRRGSTVHPRSENRPPKERAPSAQGERAPSVQGEQALSTQGERALSTQGERALSIQGERALSIQGEQALSTQGEGALSIQGERVLSTQGEGALSTQGESTVHPRRVGTVHPRRVGTVHPRRGSTVHPRRASTVRPRRVSTADTRSHLPCLQEMVQALSAVSQVTTEATHPSTRVPCPGLPQRPHTPAPVFFRQGVPLPPRLGYNGGIMAHCSLKLLGSSNPPISASQSPGITGVSHYAQLPNSYAEI